MGKWLAGIAGLILLAISGSSPTTDHRHQEPADPEVPGPLPTSTRWWRFAALIVGALLAVGAGWFIVTEAPTNRRFIFAAVAVLAILGAAALIATNRPSPSVETEVAVLAAGLAVAVTVLAVQLGADDRRANEANQLLRELETSRASAAEEQTLRSIFNRSDLSYVDLRGRELSGVSAANRPARLALFDGTQLRQVDFGGTDLTEASFRNATATLSTGDFYPSINFSGADLTEADFSRARFRAASFVGADLTGADLAEFQCLGCDFRGALIDLDQLVGVRDLTGSIFRRADVGGVGVEPNDLGAAVLGGNSQDFDAGAFPAGFLRFEDLDGSDFSNADFTNADLTGASIDGVNFSGANLTGATLTDIAGPGVIIDGETTLGNIVIGEETFSDSDVIAALTAQGGQVVNVDDDTINLRSGTWQLGGLELGHVILAPSETYTLLADGTTFESGTFSEAVLDQSSFVDADLGSTDWSGASLRLSRFDNANLGEVTGFSSTLSFEHVSVYSNATVFPPYVDQVFIPWINSDEPILNPSLNMFVAGLDLSADDQLSPLPFAQDTELTNFQAAGAAFRNRSFRGVDLLIADFRLADLRGASFWHSSLVAADLTGARLDPIPNGLTDGLPCGTGVGGFEFSQFCGAIYDGTTNWPDGYTPPLDALNLDDLPTRARLRGAQLVGVSRPGFTAIAADLTGARLAGPFPGANLTDALLRGATLTGVDLNGATMTRADLTCANLTGASLRGADLTGVRFDGTILGDADLSNATLDPGALDVAIINESTVLPPDYEALSPAAAAECADP